MTTSTSIMESPERFPTTKDKIFWAIQKGFVQVFITEQGDLFFGNDVENDPDAFAMIEAGTFEMEVFDYSGTIGINAEEMAFLCDIASKGYRFGKLWQTNDFHKYSLLEKE
jgi:hypothetical protein